MAIEVRKISWWDTLRLQRYVSVPAFLWGLVAPNRLFVSCLSRLNAGQSTIRFLGELREKYRCDHLWSWFPFGRTLLVLSRESMDAVLFSKENAADPTLKTRKNENVAPFPATSRDRAPSSATSARPEFRTPSRPGKMKYSLSYA